MQAAAAAAAAIADSSTSGSGTSRHESGAIPAASILPSKPP